MRSPLFVFLILLAACGGDPVLEAAREEAARGATPAAQPGGAQPGGAQPGGAQPGGQPGAPMTPGQPDQPPPGQPDQPPPGQPGEPPPGEAGQPTGPTVTLRGEVRCPGCTGGVRLDVFDGDHSRLGGPRPSVVARAELAAAGAFELRVPQGGPVWISAFNDEDGDGRPGPVEPFGECTQNPVSADEDAGGLVLELKRRDPPR